MATQTATNLIKEDPKEEKETEKKIAVSDPNTTKVESNKGEGLQNGEEKKNDSKVETENANENLGDDEKEEKEENGEGDEKDDKDLEEDDDKRIWDDPSGGDASLSKTNLRYRLAIQGLSLKQYVNNIPGLHKKVIEIFQTNNYGGNGKLTVTPLVRRPLPGETDLQLQLIKSDKVKIMNAYRKGRFRFKGPHLTLRTVQYVNVLSKEVKLAEEVGITLKEVVDSTLPNMTTPYPMQLKAKEKKGMGLFKLVYNNRFKAYPLPKWKKIVPAPMIDNYAISIAVCLMREESTGKIYSGMKIPFSRMKVLVPLEELTSVPKQFVQVTKSFSEWAQEPGNLIVCERVTKEGEVSGLLLQMNTLGQVVLTLLVKAPAKEVPENSSPAEIPKPELGQDMIDHVKEKMEQFHKAHGAQLCIEDIYMKPHENLRNMWSRNHIVHLMGSKVKEPLASDMGLYVEPTRVWSSPSRAFAAVVQTIVQMADIGKKSVLILMVDDFKYIPFVFAQKAQEVIVLGRWGLAEASKTIAMQIRGEAKSLGANSRIQLFSGNLPLDIKPSRIVGSILIIWETLHNPTELKKLLGMGLEKVVFVCLRLEGIHKICKEIAQMGLVPSEVALIDTLPHTLHYGMIILFTVPGKRPGVPMLMARQGFGMNRGMKRRFDGGGGRGGKMPRNAPPLMEMRHFNSWDSRRGTDNYRGPPPRPLFDNGGNRGPLTEPWRQPSDPIRTFLENCLVRGLGSLAGNPEALVGGGNTQPLGNIQLPQQQVLADVLQQSLRQQMLHQSQPEPLLPFSSSPIKPSLDDQPGIFGRGKWESSPQSGGDDRFGGVGPWSGGVGKPLINNSPDRAFNRPDPIPLLPKPLLRDDGRGRGAPGGPRGGRLLDDDQSWKRNKRRSSSPEGWKAGSSSSSQQPNWWQKGYAKGLGERTSPSGFQERRGYTERNESRPAFSRRERFGDEDFREGQEQGPSTSRGGRWDGGGTIRVKPEQEMWDVEESFNKAEGKTLTEKVWGPHNVSMTMTERYGALGRSFPPYKR